MTTEEKEAPPAVPFPSRKIRLAGGTVRVLSALAECGAAGATAQELAKRTDMDPRQAGARLRWLQRVAFAEFQQSPRCWRLADHARSRSDQGATCPSP